MTTTSLKLSKQLAALWPEWETEYYWCRVVETGMSGQPMITEKFLVAAIKNKYTGYIAPTLDELRVFALEKIGSEPTWPPDKWDRWYELDTQFKNALIQGCDPTAEFIINSFGKSKEEK